MSASMMGHKFDRHYQPVDKDTAQSMDGVAESTATCDEHDDDARSVATSIGIGISQGQKGRARDETRRGLTKRQSKSRGEVMRRGVLPGIMTTHHAIGS